MPGPEARVLLTLSEWAKLVGFKNTGVKLFQLGRTIDDKRLEAALRSGRLVQVTLPFNGNRIAPREIMARVLDFGRSNEIQVVSAIASQRTSIDPIMRQSMYDVGKSNGFEFVSTRFPPDEVQIILDSKGTAQMVAFVRGLNKTKVQPTTAQDAR
jgi:hypothetical protein